MIPAPEAPNQEKTPGGTSAKSPLFFGVILAVNVAALGYLTWELRNYTEAKNSAAVALSLKAANSCLKGSDPINMAGLV